ncbi:hypothetical protein LMG28614_02456 [Paraburkholderia ultramafica]|uniref:Uncharacterized protein n=1 Tax=Paraburkholderia ultramafica TaxID=1544867 RepID=A0A6S7B458_9BURK|nr:hypothetical protein LMG28614_02456 [Paraburkholderia ultramafica]
MSLMFVPGLLGNDFGNFFKGAKHGDGGVKRYPLSLAVIRRRTWPSFFRTVLFAKKCLGQHICDRTEVVCELPHV